MKNNRLKIWRLLRVWDQEKEETWLRDMAQKGYHLTNYKLCRYSFEKGKPKDYTYKLDFQVNIKDFPEYQSIFQEAGWELVTRCGTWYFFRTEADNSSVPEIYSDSHSQVEKYKRILRVLAFAVILNLISFLNLAINPALRQINSAITVLLGFEVIVMILLTFAMVNIMRKLKLKNKSC